MDDRLKEMQNLSRMVGLLGKLFKAHPWHGVSMGENQPKVVTAYIEVVPSDTVKYELDKVSGHLKVDRPQIYSNICPTMYGMIPQTLCGQSIANYCTERTGLPHLKGDGDPLDICVLSEKMVPHGDILLRARPIGGFRMIDHGEADDKILAVMQGDALYGEWNDISDVPDSAIARLKHYFLTYKQSPDSASRHVHITHMYNREEAYEVIARAHADYLVEHGELASLLGQQVLLGI